MSVGTCSVGWFSNAFFDGITIDLRNKILINYSIAKHLTPTVIDVRERNQGFDDHLLLCFLL